MSQPQRLRAHDYGHTEQCNDDKRTIKIKSWVLARLTGPQGTICLTVYFLFYYLLLLLLLLLFTTREYNSNIQRFTLFARVEENQHS